MKNNIMKYKEYRAKIEYDGNDNIFVGEVIGIKDIIAFHADTIADLEQHFHDCLDSYLDMCKECGEEPEKDYSGSFSVRVEPEDQKIATLCASVLGISLNQYFGKALAAYNKKNMALLK